MPTKGRVPSVDASRFAMVPRPDVPRSAFDVPSEHKTTFNAGYLIPFYVDEVLPGDSLRLSMTAFCRLSTPLFPIMDNLEFESAFFFVPYRLVWANFKRFMGEQANPTDTTQFLIPQATFAPGELPPTVPGTIADYMGITNNTIGAGNNINVSALPFRAYNLIWDQWFRDEDIQTRPVLATTDGPDAAGTYGLLSVAKKHDYFTSARPWPQKQVNAGLMPDATGLSVGALASGFPGVAGFQGSNTTPLGGVGAPVTGIGFVATAAIAGPANTKSSGARLQTYDNYFNAAANPVFQAQTLGVGGGDFPDVRVLINDLRTAALVQMMLERDARGGTRYTEKVRSHFGVVSPDARLQRPEYLGGGRTLIQINPVAQTSASGVAGTSTKLAELSAYASGMVRGHGFHQSFSEHGVLLGLCWVRAFQTYQQGIERMWFRRSLFDFYWPTLAHLGEQAIQQQEIFANGSLADAQTVFGYQERWSEYKYKPSRTSGYFRSTVATPLDQWHLGIAYGGAPVLNNSFITENPPISRVSQVATNFGEDFLMDSRVDCRWVRAMPMFSVPGMGARL